MLTPSAYDGRVTYAVCDNCGDTLAAAPGHAHRVCRCGKSSLIRNAHGENPYLFIHPASRR